MTTSGSIPSLPSYQQQEIQPASLVSGDTFSVDIASDVAPGTTIYTARADAFFRIRKAAAVNATGGQTTLNIYVNGELWYTEGVGPNSTSALEGFSGQAIPPSATLSATGDGLRIVGWGIQAQGGPTWFL